MAEPGSPRIRWRSVRVRTTAGAAIVVGMVLLVAGVTLVLLLRRSLTEDVRSATAFRADAIAELLEGGTELGELPLGNDDDEFVQIIDGDTVVEASILVEDEKPLIDLSSEDVQRIAVPFEDDPFLALSRRAQTPDGSYTIAVGRTMESVDDSSRVVVGLLLFGLPLLLLAVLLVTWRIVGRALAPVESLRGEVESISAERLDKRLAPPGTGDEIARLAATMNRMLERLQKSRDLQRRFVSDASHELRSPVATIRQHAEVALRHPSQTSLEELARVVLDEDLRIQHLVEDLLLLARMDEGAAPARQPVDLDDIVFEEVTRRELHDAVSFDVRRVSAGRVLGDAKQLARLVSNLMDNAERHARGTVRLVLIEDGDEVVFTIEDDGRGIPDEQRRRVFERFVRLDEARDRRGGGVGLGLAIVAEVARAHGGRVALSSSSLGGALFEVRLPRAAD